MARAAGAKRTKGARSDHKITLDDPSLYVNRELSLLEFQKRVLEEAENEANPVLERVKFLSILASNIDEFFMVRVAGLQNQVDARIFETGPDGLTAAQQLDAIHDRMVRLITEAHQCRKRLFADLEKNGIRIVDYDRLNESQKEYADRYFINTIYPVLTPLAFDPGRPFPHISNLSLNLAASIRDTRGQHHFARVKVPDSLPQLLPLQKTTKPNGRPLTYVWLEQVIQANLHSLFPGMEVMESHPFHVTRDADFEIQELEAGDLLETVEEGVRKRRFGAVVRLTVDEGMPDTLLDVLQQNLEIEDSDIYRIDGPLALVRLRSLTNLHRPEFKDPPFVAAPLMGNAEEEDLFAMIRRTDYLLHHPFDSFQPVVDFLRSAARDPNVLAIKMSLYRVGKNAPVVEALLEAMEHGKQVAVLVELKARFDEESNIEWARALEREGVHVVYGLMGLKIHAKVLLVVRREGEQIRRYVHLSTGNYNAVTAHLYTDLGLFTSDPDIGADASDLFNYLTGYSAKSDYRKLLVAPINLRQRLEALVEREITNAKAGKKAHIIFKVNALVDPPLIKQLYRASQAGVKVDLIARGICCLRPGIAGISENIRVISIVGRFLEHTRIFYFLNGGEDEEIYLGSADLMPRNINRRVEVLFPIEKPSLVRHLRERVLAAYLADNVKARIMQPDGTYKLVKKEKGEKEVNSQVVLMERKRIKGA
ncbi:MAG TPA: polyphosphate kinase 1 [Bryobacteraceae bacterium]|nr:polyphosphate kinase 1 [Bryobacteraceae bacterium]